MTDARVFVGVEVRADHADAVAEALANGQVRDETIEVRQVSDA